MCTLDNITKLLKINNKTQKDLTDFLGITKNSFTNWKSGHNKSYMKYLPQIADYFGVSVDYLMGREEKPSHSIDQLLDEEDFSLFGKVKELTADEKEDVLNFINFIKSKRK